MQLNQPAICNPRAPTMIRNMGGMIRDLTADALQAQVTRYK